MINHRSNRGPNCYCKRRSYPPCFKVEDQREKKCFEIVGRKIQLHHRGRRGTSNKVDTEAINAEFGIFDMKACGDVNLEFRRATITYDDKHPLELKNNDSSEEKEEASLGDKRLNPTSPTSGRSINGTSGKGFLKKRSPHITISLPSIQNTQENQMPTELDESCLFKEKMYMVCQQSPSCYSNWHTTCVTFPDETWKLDKRRLSHRHSSFSSSISLSLTRLDLACKTPEASLMSTPVDGSNFVFPKL